MLIAIPLEWVSGEFGASDGFSPIELARLARLAENGSALARFASTAPTVLIGLMLAAPLLVPLGRVLRLPPAPLRWIEGMMAALIGLAALSTIALTEIAPPARLIEGAGAGPFLALAGALLVLGTRVVARSRPVGEVLAVPSS